MENNTRTVQAVTLIVKRGLPFRWFRLFHYGSMGAVVVLLLWFLLSAWAVLIGAEIDATPERSNVSDPGD